MVRLQNLGLVCGLFIAACSAPTTSVREDGMMVVSAPRIEFDDSDVRVTAANVVLPYDPSGFVPPGHHFATQVSVLCKNGSQASAQAINPHSSTILFFNCGRQKMIAVQNKSPLGYAPLTSDQNGPVYRVVYYDRVGFNITPLLKKLPFDERDLLEK